MKIAEIKDLLGAELLCGEDCLDHDVESACCSDMMSDVLAYVKDQGVLITGLVNPQVIRTASMMDMIAQSFFAYCISFLIYYLVSPSFMPQCGHIVFSFHLSTSYSSSNDVAACSPMMVSIFPIL